MKTTKITQSIGRTIQLNENDYIKLHISREAEIGFIYDAVTDAVTEEDPVHCQQDLFKQIKKELNQQAKDLLAKAYDKTHNH